jgi:hypothetical protein
VSDQRDSSEGFGPMTSAGPERLHSGLPQLAGSAPIAEPVFLGGDELRAELVNSVKRYKSMRQFALAHGISPAIVSLTIAGKREPDRAVAAALGFVVHTSFIRIMENRNV